MVTFAQRRSRDSPGISKRELGATRHCFRRGAPVNSPTMARATFQPSKLHSTSLREVDTTNFSTTILCYHGSQSHQLRTSNRTINCAWCLPEHHRVRSWHESHIV